MIDKYTKENNTRCWYSLCFEYDKTNNLFRKFTIHCQMH